MVYDETGRAFRVGQVFAHGGEGVISQLEDNDQLCVKLYRGPLMTQQKEKFALLRARALVLAPVAALPVSLAYATSERKVATGVFLPFVHGRAIFELYGSRSRLEHFPRADFRFLVHAAHQLAVVFERLHQAGVIVGDVNEQNIRILPDATVRLVDCDSFQLTDQDRIYPSNVGSLLWTPPELQGRDLTAVARTPNHDGFGLAQLIFLLLFVGRHPFAGIPRDGQQLLPEEAIRIRAFAFAPECLGSPLRPPPGCLSLAALPAEIQHAFLRAFRNGSDESDARPTATEWKTHLDRLLHNLTVCPQHSRHVYWQGISNCPWCGIIRETGVDLFPSATPANGFAKKKLTGHNFLARLNQLAIHPFYVQSAPRFEFAPKSLPAPPTGFWFALQRVLMPKRWRYRWLNPMLRKERHALSQAQVAVRRAVRDQSVVIAAYHREFWQARTALQAALLQLAPTNPTPQNINEWFEQIAPSVGTAAVSVDDFQRFTDELEQCELTLAAAERRCVAQLESAQTATVQAAQLRDQAQANLRYLLRFLRGSTASG